MGGERFLPHEQMPETLPCPKYTLCQNPCKKQLNQIETVLNRGKVISPHNHTYEDYKNDNKDKKYARVFTNMKIGDTVFVPESGGDEALICEITSDLKKEECGDMVTVSKGKKSCDCAWVRKGCQSCEDDILFVGMRSLVNIPKGSHVEPLYTFYKDVVILYKIKKSWYKNLPYTRGNPIQKNKKTRQIIKV